MDHERQKGEPNGAGNSRRVRQFTDYGNSNIIIPGYVRLRRLHLTSIFARTEDEYVARLRAGWPQDSDASLEIIALAGEAVRAFPCSGRLWIMRGNLIELGPESCPYPLDEVRTNCTRYCAPSGRGPRLLSALTPWRRVG